MNATRPAIVLLEIEQPNAGCQPESNCKIFPFIGEIPDDRFARIDEILVNRVASGEGGFVGVHAAIVGDLGEVYGPSFLDMNLDTGDVIGPIVCFGHHEKPGISLHSAHGSLKGDVAIFPPPCDVHPQTCPHGYVPTVQGHINFLDFRNGTIGEEGKPVTILADNIIQEVYAGAIYANIRGTDTDPANPSFDSFAYLIGNVRAGWPEPGDGIFDGEIRAQYLCNDGSTFLDELRFEEEMRGRIWVQTINHLGLVLPRTPRGLIGTVSVGTLDPGNSEDWNGIIQIGQSSPIELDEAAAAGYDFSAEDLGGGAAGLVPFLLHRSDCFPKQGEAVAPANSPRYSSPIRMRHYGPVTWDAGNGDPFIVERRARGSSGSWQEQSCFTCEPDEDNDTIVWVKTTGPRAHSRRG